MPLELSEFIMILDIKFASTSKHFTWKGESPQPPMCSTWMMRWQPYCAHHTPAYWWRRDGDEANQYMGIIKMPRDKK